MTNIPLYYILNNNTSFRKIVIYVNLYYIRKEYKYCHLATIIRYNYYLLVSSKRSVVLKDSTTLISSQVP